MIGSHDGMLRSVGLLEYRHSKKWERGRERRGEGGCEYNNLRLLTGKGSDSG